MVVTAQQMWEQAPGEVWIYLIILASVYILYVLKDYIRCTILMFRLKGPKTEPILGNARSLIQDDLLDRLSNENQLYGRVVRVWLAGWPFVAVIEPEDIQVIFGSMKHTHKTYLYKFLSNFLGKGLITTDVNTWKIHRKFLQPVFHIQILERFTTTFAERSNDLMNEFLVRNGTEIDVTKFVNDTVYDILRETVLGMKRTSRSSDSSVKDDDLPFRKGQVMLLYRLMRPWLLIEWIYRLTEHGKQEQRQRRDLFDTCFKIMKEKRDLLREKNIESDGTENTKKVSLLEYMVEMNEKNPCLTDEDIVEECCTFMLAGQDSVGTATAMTLFLLATHPEWQEKCIQELDDIFDGDSRPSMMKDLKEMKCLEMCIKEALRMYPSVPLISRKLVEDVKIGKHVIPAGCSVIMSPYCTHHLPTIYPEPHLFKPERFDPVNSEKRHPYAYLPFSAGPRNCIGYKFAMLEMKSIISAILRKCRLLPVPGKEKIRPKFRLTIRAQGGLWVKVKARDETVLA